MDNWCMHYRSPRRIRERESTRKFIGHNNVWKFLKISTQSGQPDQGAQNIPNKNNPKKSTMKHQIVKVWRQFESIKKNVTCYRQGKLINQQKKI